MTGPNAEERDLDPQSVRSAAGLTQPAGEVPPFDPVARMCAMIFGKTKRVAGQDGRVAFIEGFSRLSGMTLSVRPLRRAETDPGQSALEETSPVVDRGDRP